MRFSATLAALGASFFGLSGAQQYMGDVINTTLPGVPGAEIAFWYEFTVTDCNVSQH